MSVMNNIRMGGEDGKLPLFTGGASSSLEACVEPVFLPFLFLVDDAATALWSVWGVC